MCRSFHIWLSNHNHAFLCLYPLQAFPSDRHFCFAVRGQSLVFRVEVRRLSVPQRLSEQLWKSLDAKLTLVGEDLAPTVWMGQWWLWLHHERDLMLNMGLVGVPNFEGRARGERVGVSLGDLGLGDLSWCNGDGQRSMDVQRGKKGFVFWVESNGLEGCRRGLAVCVIHHGVALGVVIPCCSICREKGQEKRNS